MCLRNSNSPEYSITALACCLGMKYGLLLSYILRPKHNTVKFIYSEKATKFCKIFTLLLSYVVPVKSKVKISPNFVAYLRIHELYSPVAGLSPFPCAPGKATCCASRGAISDTLNCRGAAIGITGKTEVLPNFGSYTKAKYVYPFKS